MLDEKELERAIEHIVARFDEVNTYYITKVAEQVRRSGS